MFLTIIIFLVILALLVFVHEWGHFFAAKKFGMRVEEFGFGFPPRAKKLFRKNGTLYTLNWLPLGGFVKIKGESGEQREDEDSFAHKKAWQRLIVLVAGVSMNIVLAWLLFSVGFGLGLPQVVDEQNIDQATDIKVQIVSVAPSSPAEQAGIKAGDEIVALDGNQYNEVEEVQEYIKQSTEQEILFSLQRGDDSLTTAIMPQTYEGSEKPTIGIGLVKTGIISYPWYQALWQGMKATVFTTITIITAFVGILVNLFQTGSVSADVAGPIGIAYLTGQVVNLGFIYILQFAALLSINLAIINILPIPALDGGRVLFLGIEKILRRPVDKKTEALVHNLGFLLLMLLVVLITFRDILHFTDWWEGIKGIF